MNIELLDLIIETARRMTKAGAEISRIEESLTRMCNAYKCTNCEVYATTSQLVVSVKTEDGEFLTLQKRVGIIGIDIEKFLNGAKEAKADADLKLFDENIAHQYAAYRYYQYKNQNKSVETFVSYSPYLNMISEWWKQLFGESEGKDRMGLYPTNLNFSTDLHSLGQFIQEGSKILFITQLKVIGQNNLFLNKREIDDDNLNYLKDISFNKMNLFAQEGTNKAHHEYGDVDNFTFEIHLIDEWHIGYLLYTLMYSCMISSYLLGVNPFNQPGVEFYKKEMKNLIKK